ncbi:MAG: glycosyltransferase family 39 protein [Candidatus Bathyarchaeota archaeon]|nr:glycosyltransferase family 39 protein [Candidatus Bathyarchaeota archaeon]
MVCFKRGLIDYAPLSLILLGAALVAFSMGPYQTWDTQLEFEAASNVVKMGVPYVEGFGAVIDEPPLGYYLEGLLFRALGTSMTVGVGAVTFFGLACVAVIYFLGRELFSRSTGVFAAALLSLNPWHLALTRIFLIDAQCLFFSLLSLYVGVLAIRRDSLKLALAAGLLFGAGFMTKFYAVFALIPLLIFYLHSKPRDAKRASAKLAAFALPTLAFALLWYQGVLGRSLLSVFVHNDFSNTVPAATGVVTSPFFAANFMVNYGLGLYVLAAAAFSLVVGFWFRRDLSKSSPADLACVLAVLAVLGVNTYLGAVLNLNIPYIGAVKYEYQALPFFVLLAASLAVKGSTLLSSAKPMLPKRRLPMAFVGVAAVLLLAAALLSSINSTNMVSQRDYLQYRVEPNVDYGYAFSTPAPLNSQSPLMAVQLLGFGLVLAGLLFAFRQRALGFAFMLKGFISQAVGMVNTTCPAETMITQTSNPSGVSRLKAALTKWRVAFLLFALVYGAVLLLCTQHYPLEWDEVVHLNGALFLQSGNYSSFIDTAFYPPLFDCLTALSFSALGISLFSARLLSVLFGVLALWLVFELTQKMFDSKTALLAAVLLAVMPGYFWLSRMALLETMLLFFILLSLFLFYQWLQTKKDRYVFFAGVAVGLGVLAKYQMVVALVVMAVSLLFLARGQLKRAFLRFALLIASAVVVVVPWAAAAYQVYASALFSQWLYALQVGNPEKLAYSSRFPAPIFYLIDVAWPYESFHPISIVLYGLGLAGLVFLLLRRRSADKFVLIWFACIYLFFTLITNKEWRYVLPLFPALAIAASAFIMFLLGKIGGWKTSARLERKRLRKVAAAGLAVLVAGGVAYSIYETYSVESYFDIQIKLEPATIYAMNQMQNNQSILVLCPFNFFSQDMIRFYLAKNGNDQIRVSQYPAQPVDTYTPQFNITELIGLCKQNHVKYLFAYENGGTTPYYNTTLNLQEIFVQIYASGNFSEISTQATFGANPRRVMVLTFLG